MKLKTDITHRLDECITIDKGVSIFLALLDLSRFKDVRSNPKMDLASINELSVILAPVTFVMMHRLLLRYGKQVG